MRVIAGELKGRRLKHPKGDRIRPTEDRIKENVFNLLFGPFDGAKVLDLFAGTGHIGIEFLSRGAEMCWFCDNHPQSIRLIRDNLRETGYNGKSQVFQMSYDLCLKRAAEEEITFDYIYIDPPYKHREFYDRAATWIGEHGLLDTGGRIIFEAPDTYSFSAFDHLILTRKKTYGKKIIWIYESCD
ncbi:MAG: 16S rRNA (guanine(966)-N(2))-methyltransferase RsmD [Peptoniphilus sp.]|nr:16S rRNA (guanine(966)-N(2))-methyltransferase RsmD [Peptoniphilus sp.]MDD7362956.1 16S rRNA (guanine(966)-N(2))-methyltransferase RsmD [Bacillota bacterium]MDY6044196.1 16S rRNA (guanine(966)-N(2))-methyltransferase RsmD [Peptoniphilus sp.]